MRQVKLIGELEMLMPVPNNESLWIEAKATIMTSEGSQKNSICFDEIELLLAVYKPGHKSDFVKIDVDTLAVELEWREEMVEFVENKLHGIRFHPVD